LIRWALFWLCLEDNDRTEIRAVNLDGIAPRRAETEIVCVIYPAVIEIWVAFGSKEVLIRWDIASSETNAISAIPLLTARKHIALILRAGASPR